MPTQSSPQIYARMAGLLYLFVIVLGGFAYGYVPGKLLADNAVATANNILSHEFLWRAGMLAAALVVACALAQLLFEFLLLRPVQRNITLLAVFFNLTSLAIEALANLGYFVALSILKGRGTPDAAQFSQADAWASLAVEMHDTTLNISFLFFGITCLLYGYLIARAGFLPRFLGVLMTLAGLCYGANSVLNFLNLQPAGFPWLLVPAGLSELALCLWLLIAGVNTAKWYEWTDHGRPLS
jgi:Domain of unknown function (DUF4386)